MAQNPQLAQLANLVSTANDQMQTVRESFTTLQAEIQNISNQINYKQLAIDGRKQQASVADQRVRTLQQEYTSLINQSYSAEEDELRNIQSRIQTVRAEAQQAQAQAEQYRTEAQKMEQEKQQLQAEKQQLQGKLKEFQGKCREMASYIGQYIIVARRISMDREDKARGFSGVAQVGYGADDARSKAQWKSSEAQEANTIANRLDAIARQYRSMASSNDDERDSR